MREDRESFTFAFHRKIQPASGVSLHSSVLIATYGRHNLNACHMKDALQLVDVDDQVIKASELLWRLLDIT